MYRISWCNQNCVFENVWKCKRNKNMSHVEQLNNWSVHRWQKRKYRKDIAFDDQGCWHEHSDAHRDPSSKRMQRFHMPDVSNVNIYGAQTCLSVFPLWGVPRCAWRWALRTLGTLYMLCSAVARKTETRKTKYEKLRHEKHIRTNIRKAYEKLRSEKLPQKTPTKKKHCIFQVVVNDSLQEGF